MAKSRSKLSDTEEHKKDQQAKVKATQSPVASRSASVQRSSEMEFIKGRKVDKFAKKPKSTAKAVKTNRETKQDRLDKIMREINTKKKKKK